MLGVFGLKIGMTQIFDEQGNLIPVTAVDLAHWRVLGVKNQERDGYNAVKVGLVAKKYQSQDFSSEWLKKSNNFFAYVKEVAVDPSYAVEIGQMVDFVSLLSAGAMVNAFGISKGRGFQGVVKRHGFQGGPASHGSCFNRIPGSIGSHRSQGHVPKGKRLPGHMGVDRCSVLNLEVIKVEPEHNVAFIKGSMPGNAGSLIFLTTSTR